MFPFPLIYSKIGQSFMVFFSLIFAAIYSFILHPFLRVISSIIIESIMEIDICLLPLGLPLSSLRQLSPVKECVHQMNRHVSVDPSMFSFSLVQKS